MLEHVADVLSLHDDAVLSLGPLQLPALWELVDSLVQGGHIQVLIKFPVFSLCSRPISLCFSVHKYQVLFLQMASTTLYSHSFLPFIQQ